jgi:hypothetical protein
VCQSYAAYLERKRYYHEASLLYERAGSLDQAVSMADQAGSWRRACHLARLAGWPADRLGELWRGLAARLEGEGRGEESATIFRELLQVVLKGGPPPVAGVSDPYLFYVNPDLDPA